MTGDNAEGRQKAARPQPCILQLSRPLPKVGFLQWVAVLFFPNLSLPLVCKPHSSHLHKGPGKIFSRALFRPRKLFFPFQSIMLMGTALFRPGNVFTGSFFRTGLMEKTWDQELGSRWASHRLLPSVLSCSHNEEAWRWMGTNEPRNAISCKCIAFPHSALSTKHLLPANSPSFKTADTEISRLCSKSPHRKKRSSRRYYDHYGCNFNPDIVGHGQIYQLISFLVFLSLIISNGSCHSQVLFHWRCYICWSAFHCIETSEEKSGFCPTVMVLPGHAQLVLSSCVCGVSRILTEQNYLPHDQEAKERKGEGRCPIIPFKGTPSKT